VDEFFRMSADFRPPLPADTSRVLVRNPRGDVTVADSTPLVDSSELQNLQAQPFVKEAMARQVNGKVHDEQAPQQGAVYIE
jgi:hypothetical protein